MDEDFWATIQQSFSVTRGIINLNNGGVSPSPRMVTEAFVRYTWQQEDATAYTMWQLLEPQSETIRTGLAEIFGCVARRDRDHAKRLRIARDPVDGNGFQIRRRDSDNNAGLSANADNAPTARNARGFKAQSDQGADRSGGCQRSSRRHLNARSHRKPN